MQTFLAYPDFRESARVLDPSRLGNQVYRECLTLIRGKWANHPAAKMWHGYEHYLAKYALAGLDELEERGRLYPHHRETFLKFEAICPDNGPPPWLGYEPFHAAHRSNLLRKDPEWYGQFGWTEENDLPYVWPTKVPGLMCRRGEV